MSLNRLASDGNILNFAKDGTSVGSIGAFAGDLTIGDDDVGLRFDTGTGLIPWDLGANSTGGAATNGAIDIGAASARFKDLYLSGTATIGTNGSEYANNYIRFKSGGAAFIDHLTVSQDINFRVSNASGLDKTPLTLKSDGVAYMPNGVYLGGTGAANKLDDYEEGTFTPTLTRSTGGNISATYVAQNGDYTKVGNLVYFQIYISISAIASQGTGYAILTGLPFASNQYSYTQISHVSGNLFGTTDIEKAFTSSSSLYFGGTGATNFPPRQIAYTVGLVRICGTYKTA
jgi:hypothetical protein